MVLFPFFLVRLVLVVVRLARFFGRGFDRDRLGAAEKLSLLVCRNPSARKSLFVVDLAPEEPTRLIPRGPMRRRECVRGG